MNTSFKNKSQFFVSAGQIGTDGLKVRLDSSIHRIKTDFCEKKNFLDGRSRFDPLLLNIDYTCFSRLYGFKLQG